MSDHEPKDKTAQEPEVKGGWSKPKTVGGWREITPAQTAEKTEGWRVVPAMPPNLDIVPEQEGAWHLPRPEDTIFTPEDELEIGRANADAAPLLRPEDEILEAENGRSSEALLSAPEDRETDEDLEQFSGLGELVLLVSQVEQPAAASLVLTPETPALEDEETEIDFSGPAAEREALAQATGVQAPLPDAAAIARQQVEQLSGEPAPPAEAASAEDAAAIARRQVEMLSGVQPIASTYTPIEPAAPPIDPEQEALAQKFLHTEEQVHALRQQYQAGQLTRDQLQERLRQLLILDNDDVWWMMGVDSDIWYRFDSNINDWTPSTPPRPAGWQAGAGGVPPTATSGFTPSEVIQGSLPYLPDDREATSASAYQTSVTGIGPTGEYSAGVDDMILPRPVPINDLDATMIGTAGVGLPEVRPSDAPTLDATQRYGGETVPMEPAAATTFTPAVGYDAAERPPAYDISAQGEEYQRALEQQRQSMTRRLLLIASLAIGALFILGAVVVGLVILSYNDIASQYTTQVAALQSYRPNFQTAQILDARGDLLAELNSQAGGARKPVNNLSDIAPELIYAVVATENERYYEDPGYDLIAIARAFWQNFTSGQVQEGASTITQQLASRLVLQDTGLPSADEKLREIIIASEIASSYDKNFILRLYLNEIFFGNQSYGIEAAAEFYFDKTAKDLTLAESAFLAGLIQAPATYDPVTNRQAAFNRMDDVLRLIARVPCLNLQHAPYVGQPFCIASNTILQSNGDWTGAMALQRAYVMEREYLPRASTVRYPHFINFVLAQLERQFGADEIYRRGFRVQTTLMPNIQDAAQDALVSTLQQIPFTGVNTGTVMVTDPRDGAIRAMVGSPDFNNTDIDGQVNLALTWQQPGSSIKPVVYTAALEGFDRDRNGSLNFNEYLTPASILWDVPTNYTNPPYSPVNFDGRFRGPVSVRQALANSINVPAVKAYEFIGNDLFIDISRRMGLTFLQDPPLVGLASGVGATEVRLYDMMQAYGTLANTGQFVNLYVIVGIKDNEGNDIPLDPRPQPAVRVQPEAAFLIQSILSDNIARSEVFGANSPLYIPEYGERIAAKTGTSNEARDLWTMGFTHNAVVGVWLGRPDNAPTRGGSLEHAAPIWNAVMRAVLGTLPAPDGFGPPNANVVQQDICASTGALPSGSNCPGGLRREFFIINRPPAPADQGLVVNVTIDTWTGLRANEACPDNTEARAFVNISDPFAIQWLGGAGQNVARALGLPIPPQAAPTTACSINTVRPSVNLASPASGETILGTVTFTGAVSVPENFDRYQIEINSAAAPNNFTPIVGPVRNQVPNQSSLGQWDSTQVQNGIYTIRLAVYATSNTGGYLYRTRQITIQNPIPTPTPIIVPTLSVTDTVVPIPVIGTIQIQGAPTPTATINPGG